MKNLEIKKNRENLDILYTDKHIAVRESKSTKKRFQIFSKKGFVFFVIGFYQRITNPYKIGFI